MSKPWVGLGSWAAAAEAEDQELAAAAAAAPSSGATDNNSDMQSFPTLKEAATTKTKKKTKMTLSEFYGASSGGSSRAGLTPTEMLQLPTGPQQRSPDDYSGARLGGGFSSYGRSSGRTREGESDSAWGSRKSYGGFDDDRRGSSRRDSDFDLQPSRADEVSDWGAAKKAMAPPSMDSGRVNRYDSLGAGSRADSTDSWSFDKKPMGAAPPSRSTAFGSGYRDTGLDSDRWRRGGEEREGETQLSRPRLVLDPPRGDTAATEPPQPVEKTNKPNPFGAARPREEILAEKGLDWKKIESEIDAKKSAGSRPTSSQGSRPSSAHSSRSEGVGSVQPGTSIGAEVQKPRPRANPFGDAKPREVVLLEKGKDWRKIDLELEHRAIDRPETEEEKALKEEIDNLKKELEKETPAPSDPSEESGADQTTLRDRIQLKERELETLIRDLNDKVRFGQKATERPGSGAGRFGSFSDRPPSQSGSVDDGRSTDFVDRPRSRGTGDAWARPGEDRRGSFHGGRDRGFSGNRDFNRPASGQRW